MLTFTDLIKSGVGTSCYSTNVVGSDSGYAKQDRFIINYNNIWGVVTDTHMSKGEDSFYYITGSMIADERKAERLLYGLNVGNYYFSNSSLGNKCSNLFAYLRMNRMKAERTIVNGDFVLKIVPMSEEEVQ